MQRLLGEAFREMSAAINAYGGDVEKYVGDAILALFGARVSHADDAERALRAADACMRWPSASGISEGAREGRGGVETGERLGEAGERVVCDRGCRGHGMELVRRHMSSSDEWQ